MTFLLRFWPHLLIGVAILAAGVWINRLGYESGYNASEARWRPAFDAANKALAAANERTSTLEAASMALTQQYETRYAQSLASLQTRAADADVRVRGLMRDLAKRSSCRELPEVPGPAPEPDAASSSAEHADRAGRDLVALARRCEADAAALTLLQQWIKEQQTLAQQAIGDSYKREPLR